MPHKITVVKLSIDVDFIEANSDVASSTKIKQDVPDDAPDFLRELASGAIQILKNHGFRRYDVIDATRSTLNGGYSLYLVYLLESSDAATVKLIVDLRTSNHPAKPDYASSQKRRKQGLDKIRDAHFNSSVGTEPLDLSYRNRDWGVQIFVGSTREYSQPVDSIEQALDIFDKKVAKLVEKYS